MSRNTGRNEPCPCGSGKKYKKCCLRKEREAPTPTSEASGQFRFEPGSYGEADKGFAPAALCWWLTTSDEWAPHFVLANPQIAYDSQDEAADQAVRHLDMAFAEGARTGEAETAAMMLNSLGYMKVDNYRLVDFQSAEPGGCDERDE